MSPDPRFLFATPAHREALAGLTYGVMERKGFMVLTGEVGTGKTTVLRALMGALPADVVAFCYVINPILDPQEFLEYALADFGLRRVPSSKAQRLDRLGAFLTKRHEDTKISAIIVDEAQRLSPEVLEEIRLLTNFETATEKMLQIVLVGQPELGDVLSQPNLRQLKQRIALRFKVRALSVCEVVQYIEHRWSRAGAPADPPFTPQALAQIAHYSDGIPRVINAICESSLMLAFASEESSIGSDRVADAARDLDLVGTLAEPVAAGGGNEARLESPAVFTTEEWKDEIAIPSLERYPPPKASSTRRFRWFGKPDFAQ